jgi:transposase
MREKYPSDISQEAFEVIKAELLAATKPTKARKYDIYDVFCAVLYVLKEGCTWRAIPHDFPKWQNCYYHFRIWEKQGDTDESFIDRLLRKLVISVRNEDCRTDRTTKIIVDSMSVQNTDLSEEKGYDAGKKLPE